MTDQFYDLIQFCTAALIFFFDIFHSGIGDHDDLLTEVIKCDDLVKKHHIHILEALGILRIQIQLWLAVFHIVIGEISNQTAGKGRKTRNLRTCVLL